MDLEIWLARNRERLGSDYEVLFVRNVLAQVSELDARTLSAQFHFVDDDGRNRYCDFVVQEGDDLRIAIEVDGYDKRGTGQGMTRDEFLDWQRRQAALVSQGWRVLRFANVDVRDRAEKCAEHLELLLRSERSKASHQRRLEERILAIERQRETGQQRVADPRADYAVSSTPSAAAEREAELALLRQSLAAALQAGQLSDAERARLDALEGVQQKAQVLEKETNIMKTTIWALTALMTVLLVFIFIDRLRPDESAMAAQSAQPVTVEPLLTATPSGATTGFVAPPVSVVGASCTRPLPWQEARNRVGSTVAMLGPVVRVTVRDDIRGKPVFITLGQPFPSRQRLDVVIWEGQREPFASLLASGLEGRDACVLGEIVMREGVPQVVLRDRTQLQPQ